MNKLQVALATLVTAGTMSLALPAPALADSAASTRNIILGVAAIAGIAIESNVAHKNAQANTITGYLHDGSRVYGDGHVVNGNGDSYYPAQQGQQVSCTSGRCDVAFNNGPADRGNARNDSAHHAGAGQAKANAGAPNYRGFGGEHRDRQPVSYPNNQ
jgi:hypothetical protein